MAARFRKNRPDRLTRLATAIEALGARDEKLIAESRRVEGLRLQGAMQLHRLCRTFVDGLNARLSQPSVVLSPGVLEETNFDDTGANLFQINLRGRLLQFEFQAMADLYGNDDFKLPYVLRGAVRLFNQELLRSPQPRRAFDFLLPRGRRRGLVLL